MKILLQRVSSASVAVDNATVAKINNGLLLLVGYGKNSSKDDNQIMINKVLNLRVFSNADGKFDYSALDVKAEILAVSQFTLYADTQKGRRPDFNQALEPKLASEYFSDFIERLKESGLTVESGIFGADMQVSLCNSGPVTIMLST